MTADHFEPWDVYDKDREPSEDEIDAAGAYGLDECIDALKEEKHIAVMRLRGTKFASTRTRPARFGTWSRSTRTTRTGGPTFSHRAFVHATLRVLRRRASREPAGSGSGQPRARRQQRAQSRRRTAAARGDPSPSGEGDEDLGLPAPRGWVKHEPDDFRMAVNAPSGMLQRDITSSGERKRYRRGFKQPRGSFEAVDLLTGGDADAPRGAHVVQAGSTGNRPGRPTRGMTNPGPDRRGDHRAERQVLDRADVREPARWASRQAEGGIGRTPSRVRSRHATRPRIPSRPRPCDRIGTRACREPRLLHGHEFGICGRPQLEWLVVQQASHGLDLRVRQLRLLADDSGCTALH